jgi:hypothetical protein
MAAGTGSLLKGMQRSWGAASGSSPEAKPIPADKQATRPNLFTAESLAMPRPQISLWDSELRLSNGRGSIAIRDWSVMGLKRLTFPPRLLVEYRFGLAFREQSTGTLILDNEDEYYDSLALNQNPQDTPIIVSQDAVWQPNLYTRTGTFHLYVKGQLISFAITSRLSLSADDDEIYLEVEIESRMSRPLALTAIPDQLAARYYRPDIADDRMKSLALLPEPPPGESRKPCFVFDTDPSCKVVVVSDAAHADGGGWHLEIPAKGTTTTRFALLLQDQNAPAPAGYYLGDVAARVEKGQLATRERMRWASEQMPAVTTANRQLDEFYRRSILTLLLCRLDRPDYIVRPFYEAGGRSAAVAYSWDMYFTSETLALLDPEGLKGMLLAFFRMGILKHAAIRWDGVGKHWYAEDPFAILRTIRDYLRQTGDTTLLDHVEGGTTLLTQMKDAGKELNNRFARPDGLLDMGEGTGKVLEIRTNGYEHVVAALNGLAVEYFLQIAEWCRERGDPEANQFQKWADRLQAALNGVLWNEAEGWFENLYPDGSRHLVLSYNLFDLLEVPAIPLERRRRMISRIKEGEFLGPFGMYSIARTDRVHYDREDCDWGGGGQYVAVPPRIAESLYRLGERQIAWDVLSRCTRWVEAFPYFPQTIYADKLALQNHQVDWPIVFSGGSGAQAVLFGVFGLRPQMDGSLEISPAYNGTLGEASMTAYKFHNHKYDVMMDATHFRVIRDGQLVAEKRHGQTVRVSA